MSMGIMLYALRVTLLIMLEKLGHTSPADNIIHYSAMATCNNTLDVEHMKIGVLDFNVPTSSLDINIKTYSCRATLTAPNDMYIGLQFLVSKQKDNCSSYVHIDKKYCQNNITLYKEINNKGTDGDSDIQLTFVVSPNDGIASKDSREVNVSVLFYAFSMPTPVFADCPNGLKNCATRRCLPNALFAYRDVYNLCQTKEMTDTPKQTTATVKTQADENGTYSGGYVQGLIIFGTVLGLFFIVLLVIYWCTKSDNGSQQPARSANRTNRHITVFTLSEDADPPPNYSDIALDNDNVNDFEDQTSTTRANVDTSLSPHVHAQFRVSTDASLGRVSNNLPPTYSDVIINEEKYHIHT